MRIRRTEFTAGLGLALQVAAAVLVVSALVAVGSYHLTRADHLTYQSGDVFVGVGGGQIKRFNSGGTLLETLDTTKGISTGAGMCFDASGNLYATNFPPFPAGNMTKFNNQGAVITHPWGGPFSANPESCVVDAAGEIYTGEVDGASDIRKFDSSGTLLASYDPAVGPRGTDWIDLAADQCTMSYTSEGSSIRRFNVCTATQLPDFCTACGSALTGMRIYPAGGVFVADFFAGLIRRFNAAGSQVQTYTDPGLSAPFAFNLDPDGESFWTADFFSGDVFRFRISDGSLLTQFNAGTFPVGGLAVFGEMTAAQPTPTPSETPTPTPTPTPTSTTPTPTPAPPGSKLPDPSIIGYWQFDEGSGSTAFDSSGYGNDGTLTNGPVWVPGKLGTALQFDGADDCVALPTLYSSSPTELTAMAWVDFTPASFTSQGLVVYHGDNGEWSLGAGHPSGKLFFSVKLASGGWQVVLTDDISTGWHHVAGTWTQEGTDNLKLYVDGNLKAAVSVPASLLFDPGSGFRASIGSYGQSSTESIEATIDEPKVYNRALTGPEIAERAQISSKISGTPHVGDIFPVAGGVGDGFGPLRAAFAGVHGLDFSPDGALIIADTNHNRVRRIEPSPGSPSGDGNVDGDLDEKVSTIAGNGFPAFAGDGGPATEASLFAPLDIAFDTAGNMYIADANNNAIRKVTPGADGKVDGDPDEVISTIAGNGLSGYCGEDVPATGGACLFGPSGVDVDAAGNVYAGDIYNHRVAQITPGGLIRTVAGVPAVSGSDGDGGPATSAHLTIPYVAKVDSSGDLFITSANRIRMVTKSPPAPAGDGNIDGDADEIISTAAGDGTFPCTDGPATTSQVGSASHLFIQGPTIWMAEQDNCNKVRRLDGGTFTTVAGNGVYTGSVDGPGGDPSDDINDGGSPLAASLAFPSGVAVDSSGAVYLADRNNQRIRRVADGVITTVAGTGLPDYCGDGLVAITSSCLDQPSDVTMDAAGNIYIADPGNHRVRMVDSSATMGTLVGKTEQTNCPASGGPAASICLAKPMGVAALEDGHVYISDRDGHRIWLFIPGGSATRVAGNGTTGTCIDQSALDACLNEPRGLDDYYHEASNETYLFVAQESGSVVRINLDLLTAREVFSDGSVTTDVAVDRTTGEVYLAQPGKHRIVRLATGGDRLVDGGEGSAVVAGVTDTAGLATNGELATDATLNSPSGVEIDSDGHLLIADTGNHRMWVLSFERIYRIAGGGDPTPGYCNDSDPDAGKRHNARDACLDSPGGLFYHDIGTDQQKQLALYFADTGNNRIRKIPSDCDSDGLTDLVESITGVTIKTGLTPVIPGPNPGTARTQECLTDTDGDGCPDPQELLAGETNGGRRDPTNPWDFYDVSGDRVVELFADVLAVIGEFDPVGYDPGEPATYSPGLKEDYDRGSAVGQPNYWNMTAPDGKIELFVDILGVIGQVFHDCR